MFLENKRNTDDEVFFNDLGISFPVNFAKLFRKLII